MDISGIVELWPVIAAALSGLVAVATLVTRLTPSPADDEWVRKVAGWLSFLQHADVGGAKVPLTRPRPAPADEPLIRLDEADEPCECPAPDEDAPTEPRADRLR